MTLSCGSRLGPYEAVARVGAGGMGEVWRARDERLGRDVAIKVLPASVAADPERVKRFEKEARATGTLNHPNILSIYDIGSFEGSPYLVEELLEGQTLREVLRSGALPARRAVEVAVQVAHGLAAAHGKGIVHRDLKPGNVFVTTNGQVKILDFGLAKLTRPEVTQDSHAVTESGEPSTESGTVLGTMGYMAPEQVRGMPCDHRADIFALGCVLYEMLSGRRAFKGPTPADTMSAILMKEPPPLVEGGGEIPAALQEIVSRCLEKRPEDRFSSAHDLALALQASSTMATAATPKRSVIPRRHRLLIGGAILAAAVIAAALAVWRPWQTSPEDAAPERPSLVAVPCKVYGAPEVAFLTDAVPQTISTLLGQVEGIDTKVPPTSLEAEKVGGDLGRIAELYGVSSVVVTSLTETAGIFALNIQLVDVRTRSVKWSRQLEGSREAYNDLARQAAEGIRLAVMPGAAPVPTSAVSSEAELALQEGVHLATRYSLLHNQSDFDAGILALKRALELDPSVNVARAHIAWTYLVKYENEYGRSGALNDAEAWARRALDVDGRCGRAWGVLSWVALYSTTPDIERQLEHALKGASLSPTDPFIHMAVANSLQTPGALFLSLPPSRRVSEVDPFYVVGDLNVAMALSLLGRPEEALPSVDRVLRVEPDFELGAIIKGLVLLRLGRLGEVRETLARGEPQFLGNPSRFWSQMWGQTRFGLAVAEQDAATIEKLERTIVSPLLDGGVDSITLGNGSMLVSPGLARLGRTDESIRILLRSVEAGVPPPYDWLLRDPDIQLLRGDSRFAQVLAASRDGAARIARILEAARARGELPAYLEQPLDELVLLLGKKNPNA